MFWKAMSKRFYNNFSGHSLEESFLNITAAQTFLYFTPGIFSKPYCCRGLAKDAGRTIPILCMATGQNIFALDKPTTESFCFVFSTRMTFASQYILYLTVYYAGCHKREAKTNEWPWCLKPRGQWDQKKEKWIPCSTVANCNGSPAHRDNVCVFVIFNSMWEWEKARI